MPTGVKLTIMPCIACNGFHSVLTIKQLPYFELSSPECTSNLYVLCFVKVNPLNAELNPMCHLLILLGDLTFMGKCIVSISNKIQSYTVYLYLETALHVSVGTSTHHQERIQLYLQHLVFVTQLLLSDAIVEESEPV
jgi:hypothetical protein